MYDSFSIYKILSFLMQLSLATLLSFGLKKQLRCVCCAEKHKYLYSDLFVNAPDLLFGHFVGREYVPDR
jgi:hypothetical protein